MSRRSPSVVVLQARGLITLGLYQGNGHAEHVGRPEARDRYLDPIVYDNVQKPPTLRSARWPELMRYLDSPSSLPIWCDIREYRLAGHADADLYEVLYAGKGFEADLVTLHGIEPDFDERWSEIAQADRATRGGYGAAARPGDARPSRRSPGGVENANPGRARPSSMSRELEVGLDTGDRV